MALGEGAFKVTSVFAVELSTSRFFIESQLFVRLPPSLFLERLFRILFNHPVFEFQLVRFELHVDNKFV